VAAYRSIGPPRPPHLPRRPRHRQPQIAAPISPEVPGRVP